MWSFDCCVWGKVLCLPMQPLYAVRHCRSFSLALCVPPVTMHPQRKQRVDARCTDPISACMLVGLDWLLRFSTAVRAPSQSFLPVPLNHMFPSDLI